MEQAVGRADFRFLEHPMHRSDPATNCEYYWEAETPEYPPGALLFGGHVRVGSATHGTRHGFHDAITFAGPPSPGRYRHSDTTLYISFVIKCTGYYPAPLLPNEKKS